MCLGSQFQGTTSLSWRGRRGRQQDCGTAEPFPGPFLLLSLSEFLRKGWQHPYPGWFSKLNLSENTLTDTQRFEIQWALAIAHRARGRSGKRVHQGRLWSPRSASRAPDPCSLASKDFVNRFCWGLTAGCHSHRTN